MTKGYSLRYHVSRQAAAIDLLRAKCSSLEKMLAAERHYSEALTSLARNPADRAALKEFRRASTRLRKMKKESTKEESPK